MRKPLLLTILVPMLMISGCVIPGTDFRIPIISDWFGPNIEEFRHDVVVIQSLQAIPSHTIRSGQTLTLRAYVQNLQKAESDPQETVEIELYDDCGIFKTEGVLCTGGDFKDKVKCEIKKMYPQSTAIVDWKMTANPLKIKTPCDVGVLVRYKYTTYTTSSASFVNQEEYENLVMQGKQFSEKGTIVAGEGPVKSYIEVPDQPIMVDIRGGATTDTGKGIMTFWVENKGSGELENNMIAKEDIKIEECASGELLGCKKCWEEIEESGLQLIGKTSPKFSCEIEPRNKGFITQEKTYQLTSEITYYYKFTKKIKLTIEPQIELG